MDITDGQRPGSPEVDSINAEPSRGGLPLNRAEFARWWASLPHDVRYTIDALVSVINEIQAGEPIDPAPPDASLGELPPGFRTTKHDSRNSA
jgi:hypothetical protein